MRRILITIIVVIIASLPAARAPAQTLETETARLLHRRWWKAGGAFETQTSSDGREEALPLLVEYGVTDRLELPESISVGQRGREP